MAVWLSGSFRFERCNNSLLPNPFQKEKVVIRLFNSPSLQKVSYMTYSRLQPEAAVLQFAISLLSFRSAGGQRDRKEKMSSPTLPVMKV